MINEPGGAFPCQTSTLAVFDDSGRFRGLLLTVLRSRRDFHSCRTPRCAYVLVINSHSIGQFWPVSWTINHRFGVPKRSPWLSNSKVRLLVGHQESQFGPILARFLDYYSLFWGPGVISTIDEPQGPFTRRSSTLTYSPDSSPFRALLLNLLGTQTDFNG